MKITSLLRLLLAATTFAFASLARTEVSPTTIAPLPPGAALRAASIQVRVAPDHRDWTYRIGEPVKFAVAITADSEPLENVSATCTIGPDMMPAKPRDIVVPLAGLTIDGGTLHEPGFLRCAVTVQSGPRTYRGLATAAFAPEKITAYQTEPADFDAFWAAGKAELAKIPLEPRLTLLPDQCTSTVNVYHVEFRTVGPTWTPTPARIYGILCEPKAPGKHPALLRVPDDVSITGFDDSLAARITVPQLTSVRQPLRAMGMRAVEVLLTRIERRGSQSANPIVFPVDVVSRASSSSPRSGVNFPAGQR